MNHWRIGSIIAPVFSAENESVDSEKITAAHTIAGHQARNQLHARGGSRRD